MTSTSGNQNSMRHIFLSHTLITHRHPQPPYIPTHTIHIYSKKPSHSHVEARVRGREDFTSAPAPAFVKTGLPASSPARVFSIWSPASLTTWLCPLRGEKVTSRCTRWRGAPASGLWAHAARSATAGRGAHEILSFLVARPCAVAPVIPAVVTPVKPQVQEFQDKTPVDTGAEGEGGVRERAWVLCGCVMSLRWRVCVAPAPLHECVCELEAE